MSEYLHNLIPFLSIQSINKILFILFILICLYFFNFILKDIVKKYAKLYLFYKKSSPFFKLIFNRYDSLLRPIRISINLFFVKILFDLITQSSSINTLISTIHKFLFICFGYEVIKLLLYALIVRNINKEKNARMELYNLFLNITKVFISLFVILIILINIGINITAFVTSLGIGGAILALSAKDTLTNFFDSIRLISSDAFRQGDWIETDYVEGFVTEIGLTTTKIRSFSNSFVTVPNSKLANNYIKNWSKRMVGRKIKFHVRLKISNDSKEVDRVIKEILIMLNKNEDIVTDEKIKDLILHKHTYEDGLFNMNDKYGVRTTMLVYLDEIGVYSMNILVYVFSISVEWSDWLHTKQEILKEIINIVDKSSLEFAYPKEEIFLEHKPKILH